MAEKFETRTESQHKVPHSPEVEEETIRRLLLDVVLPKPAELKFHDEDQ